MILSNLINFHLLHRYSEKPILVASCLYQNLFALQQKKESDLESCRVVIHKLFINIKIVLSNPLKFKESEVDEKLYDKQSVFKYFHWKSLHLNQIKRIMDDEIDSISKVLILL